MPSAIQARAISESLRFPVILDDIPILYEDEEEGDMGESNPHVDSDRIIEICVKAHLSDQPRYQVYSNMNLYYRDGPPHPKTGSLPYVSPDVMVVEPYEPLPYQISSYTIGEDGPAPVLTVETLSKRSAQQQDLKKKLIVYAKLGVAEYILVDTSGKYLRQRLLLKRLQPDRTWKDERDPDGGVTSRLGFRVIIDEDGRPRILNAETGKRYARPDEAETGLRRAEAAESRVRELEAELNRLKDRIKPTKRRKKK